MVTPGATSHRYVTLKPSLPFNLHSLTNTLPLTHVPSGAEPTISPDSAPGFSGCSVDPWDSCCPTAPRDLALQSVAGSAPQRLLPSHSHTNLQQHHREQVFVFAPRARAATYHTYAKSSYKTFTGAELSAWSPETCVPAQTRIRPPD